MPETMPLVSTTTKSAPSCARLVVQPGEPRDERQQVTLRRESTRRTTARRRRRARRASRSSGRRDVLQRHGPGRPDGLLSEVAVDVDDRAAEGRGRTSTPLSPACSSRRRDLPRTGRYGHRARLDRRAGRARSRDPPPSRRGGSAPRVRVSATAERIIRPRYSARSGNYRYLPRGADSPFPP